MNRNLQLALAALGGLLTGGIGVSSLDADAAAAPRVTLVNANFVRGVEQVATKDGGTATQPVWQVRACGYLYPTDGGTHVAEPCWDEKVPLSVFAPVEKYLVGDAGMP